MRFESPLFLLLILLIPIFFKSWLDKGRPPRINFPFPIPKAARSFDPVKFFLVIRCLSLVFIVIALARPQYSYKQSQRNVQGIDIMLTMDTSRSMDIEDLDGQSRISVAKRTIEDFVHGRGNDRIGFAVFSGEAVTLAPPTLDYGLLFKTIREAKTGRLKDGTAIGDGLSIAVARLRKSKAKSRVIILLTDGENNVGKIDPLTAGELAAGYGIKVYSIAIGREGRVRLPIRQTTPFGDTVKRYQYFENQLNTELLEHISESSEGKFYRVTDASTLQSVFADIDKLEKTKVKSSEKTKYREIFHQALIWGIFFLLLEQLLSLFVWRFSL